MKNTKRFGILFLAGVFACPFASAVPVGGIDVLGGRNRLVVRIDPSFEPSSQFELKVDRKKYVFDINETQKRNTGNEFTIDNLKEKDHKVTLSFKDNNGKPVKYTREVTVYGDNYEKTLPVRDLKSAIYNKEINELTLNWGNPVSDYAGAVISYTNMRGRKAVLSLPYDRTTIATRVNALEVRSAYCPDACVDTFYSVAKVLKDVPVATPKDIWGGVYVPTVVYEVMDTAKNTEGETIYRKLIKDDPTSFFANVVYRVLNALYETPQDSFPKVYTMRNILGPVIPAKEYNFPASTPAYMGSDGSGNCTMKINVTHIEKFMKDHPGEYQKLEDEIIGIFLHEFTHSYQFRCRANNREEGAFTEGMADAVRFMTGGFTEEDRVRAGLAGEKSDLKWFSRYRITGCFLMWLRNFDGDFVHKFNRTGVDLKNWSFSKAVKSILGEQYEVQDLWDQYIREVKEEALEMGIN
ncbi:basic secretory protein-like protein [Coprobacter tertius]|uniref:Plant Basic Secretory Protein n=1 Tax=Coprobacter tertius TaxID=2944915 RepID=A0ABT1MFM1_9BACT|nr:basic secretory protein-like protein [Coprobacter tertius]MCP9611430.1 hypothetical protein [Coprobacter tertius]